MSMRLGGTSDGSYDVNGGDGMSGGVEVRSGDGVATFDPSGFLASWSVSDDKDTQSWSSYRTDYDAQGNVLRQIGINDGGSFWINVYDPAGTHSWAWYTNYYDNLGHLESHTQTNDDGTHSLIVNDTTGTNTWSTFTMTFDAGWNQTSLTGTNHDGTHTVDAAAIGAFMDTLTWFPNPNVVDVAPPPARFLSLNSDLAGTFSAPQAGLPDPVAKALADLASADSGSPAGTLLAAPSGMYSSGRPVQTLADAGGAKQDQLAQLGDGSDALSALVDGIRQMTAGNGGAVAGTTPLATMLSNGMNADAGVAQLVSAMAAIRGDGSGFDSTSLGSAPSDPSLQGVIAATLG